jgi:hypothetical protein
LAVPLTLSRWSAVATSSLDDPATSAVSWREPEPPVSEVIDTEIG